MGYLIAAAVLLLLLVFTVRIGFNVKLSDDTLLTLGVGFIRIRLFPKKEKTLKLSDYRIDKYRKRLAKEQKRQQKKAEKKAKKDGEKASTKAKKTTEDKAEGDKKYDISELIELITEIAHVFFERFGRHLHIKVRRVHVIVASSDAATTAVLYGAVCGAVQCLLEVLDNAVKLTLPKNEEITVTPDFTSEKTQADVDITFSLRLWQIVDILLRSAWTYFETK